MKTVLEVITATKDYFAKNHVENPRLHIEHLLAQVLGMKRMGLYMAFERVLTEAELTPLRALVKRRAAGEQDVSANPWRIASAARQARAAASGCGSGQPQNPIALSP